MCTPSNESEIGISLFGLPSTFCSRSYLYAPRDRSTFLNWESDIFAFWKDCQKTWKEMRVILQHLDLPEKNQG